MKDARDLPVNNALAGAAFRPLRTLLIGAVGTGLVSLIVASAELVAATIQIGMMQLPPAAISLLFLIVLLNRLAGWMKPSMALTTRELAVVFIMMLFGAMLASRGLMERLIPIQVGVSYFAPANNWDKIYFPYFQPFMVPWDPSKKQPETLVEWFYLGIPYGVAIPWQAWLTSTFNWLILALAVYFAFLCIATILRKQWVENERLPFPLVQLPLEIMRGGNEFLGNRWFWFGVLLPVVIFTLNGLHKNFPTIPEVTLNYPLKPYFANPPLDRISTFTIYLSFAAVGFFFLIPTELLFSFWFFYLLSKVQEVISLSMGLELDARHASAGAIIKWECSGAFFAVAGYILYSARHHLKHVWRVVIGRERASPAEPEMMSYRVAFWGLVIAFLFIAFWCSRMGMAWWVALAVFGIYVFVQGLVMARCTAEGGLLITEGCFTPMDVFTMEKYSLLSPRNLTVMAFLDGLFTRDLRGITVTGYLDAQKIADEVQLKRRALLRTILLGVGLAILFAFVIQLWLPYRYSASNLYSYVYQSASIQFFRENAPFMSGGQDAPIPAFRPVFFIIGLVTTMVIAALRTHFTGFPLHPLGFATSATWGVVILWFSMLIAWLIKAPLLRYGGMSMFRRVRPFFLGMIFGEFLMAFIWASLAMIWNIQAPDFPWP